MKHRLTAFATVSALALALTILPASASPVVHLTLLATDMNYDQDGNVIYIECGPNSYSFTSGEFFFVFRDPSVAAHITANHVQAENQNNIVYKVLGTEKYSDPWLFVSRLLFVGPDGTVADSVNITAHLSPSGSYFGFDHGTCGY